VSAQHAAEGAIAVLVACAGLGALAGCAVVYGLRAAFRAAWKRLLRRLYPSVQRQRTADLHEKAKDAGLLPALAAQTEWKALPGEHPSFEPSTPVPGWVTTDTPSPAEITLFDEHDSRDLVRPLRRPR